MFSETAFGSQLNFMCVECIQLICNIHNHCAAYLLDMLGTISICILCYFYFIPPLILLLVQA